MSKTELNYLKHSVFTLQSVTQSSVLSGQHALRLALEQRARSLLARASGHWLNLLLTRNLLLLHFHFTLFLFLRNLDLGLFLFFLVL